VYARRCDEPLCAAPSAAVLLCVQFFQKDDNDKNDVIMLATGVAALYLVFKIFEQLETL
jgi:hypothetical protein